MIPTETTPARPCTLCRQPLLIPHKKNGLQNHPQTVAITGRDERIRTSDPVLPKHVLYQAEPHPDIQTCLPQFFR